MIQLVCNPFSRIAIYSASYGRTEYESIQCTQPQGVKEESEYPNQNRKKKKNENEIYMNLLNCRSLKINALA